MNWEDDRKKKKDDQIVSPERDSRNHNHTLLAQTDVCKSHQHTIVGTTSPAIASGDSHVHRVFVRTSYDPQEGVSHWHMIDILTSQAIEISETEHTHYFEGETSYNCGHRHGFNNITSAVMLDDEDDC